MSRVSRETEPIAIRERILAGLVKGIRPARGERPCWEWCGKFVNQVPTLNLNGRPTSVLRWLFQFGTGEIVPTVGARVLRVCGNKTCCKPSHLVVHRRGEPLPTIRQRKKGRHLTPE